MRTVFMPTDFFKNTSKTLKYTCQIFKYEISEIFIGHAYTINAYGHVALEGHSLEELKVTS